MLRLVLLLNPLAITPLQQIYQFYPPEELGMTCRRNGLGFEGMSAFFGEVETTGNVLEWRSFIHKRYGVRQYISHLPDVTLKDGTTFWDTADVYSPSRIVKSGYPSQKETNYWYKTVGAMTELVKFAANFFVRPDTNIGSWRARLGTSDCPRRSQAVQVEYSPFTLDIEDDNIGFQERCRELAVTVIAYTPLGQGLLTGQYKSPDDFEAGDFRKPCTRIYRSATPHRILLIIESAPPLRRLGSPGNAYLMSSSNYKDLPGILTFESGRYAGIVGNTDAAVVQTMNRS